MFWGEDAEIQNDKPNLEAPMRERSKSEVGSDMNRLMPILTEGEFENDLGEEKIIKSQKDADPLESITPERKSIIGRFMGLFRGREGVEHQLKLESVQPKKPDNDVITPPFHQSYARDVGMSL